MIRCYAGIMALGILLVPMASHAAGRGMTQATGQAIWNAAVNGKTTTLGVVNSPGQIRVIKPTTTGTPTALAGGGATVVDTMNVPVGNVNVPVSATTNVAKGVIIDTAVGLAAGGVLGAVGAGAFSLTTAYMNQSGVRATSTPGVYEVMDNGPMYCFTGTCYWWSYRGAMYRTQHAACKAHEDYRRANYPTLTVEWSGATNGSINACYGWEKYANGTWSISPNNYGVGVDRRDVRTADSPTWHQGTPQEIKDALYKNDPPPAIIDELSKYGNIIWPGPASVTGPAAITGPKETTVSSSGNQSTTTVSQSSTPISYSGSSITAGNTTRTSTSTTTTTNPDGSTSTSTSTSTTTTESGNEPQGSEPAEEATPSDTALPPVPDLYERKYPNGMEGIWAEQKEALKGTSLVSLVGKLMPNVGDGGTCPTWTLNLDVAQWASFGTHDVAPPCWIWDVAKAILILSALLLARALIFGG